LAKKIEGILGVNGYIILSWVVINCSVPHTAASDGLTCIRISTSSKYNEIEMKCKYKKGGAKNLQLDMIVSLWKNL
jgi:hypothetical protein